MVFATRPGTFNTNEIDLMVNLLNDQQLYGTPYCAGCVMPGACTLGARGYGRTPNVTIVSVILAAAATTSNRANLAERPPAGCRHHAGLNLLRDAWGERLRVRRDVVADPQVRLHPLCNVPPSEASIAAVGVLVYNSGYASFATSVSSAFALKLVIDCFGAPWTRRIASSLAG